MFKKYVKFLMCYLATKLHVCSIMNFYEVRLHV